MLARLWILIPAEVLLFGEGPRYLIRKGGLWFKQLHMHTKISLFIFYSKMAAGAFSFWWKVSRLVCMNQETAVWAEVLLLLHDNSDGRGPLVSPHLKTFYLRYYFRLDPQNIQAIQASSENVHCYLPCSCIHNLPVTHPEPVTTNHFPDTITRLLFLSPRLTPAQEEPFLEPRRTDGCPILNISQLSRSTSMLIQVLGNNTQPGLFVPFVFFI